MLLTEDGAVLRLPQAEIHMRLAGSRPASAIEGLGRLPGFSSYFLGNDRVDWRTGIPQCNTS